MSGKALAQCRLLSPRRWGVVALGREPSGGYVVFFGTSTGRLAPLRYKVDGIGRWPPVCVMILAASALRLNISTARELSGFAIQRSVLQHVLRSKTEPLAAFRDNGRRILRTPRFSLRRMVWAAN